MNITVTKTAETRRHRPEVESAGFGEVFSDHMFVMDYKDGAWRNASIMPYGPLPVYPAMAVLHYGQAIFEGLKAFRGKNGIAIFRPDKFHARFQRSAARLAMPAVDRDAFIQAAKELVRLDAEWVPSKPGYSLYLRPFMFASENFLGLRTAHEFKFVIIASPVGTYFKEGIKPVRLTTSTEYIRAAKGGLGDAKTPANYAASLLGYEKAKEEGFAQVIWLDAAEHRYVEEVGAMNLFTVIGDELITPPLEGTILPGVTRDTVLELAREWGMNVSERRIAIDELFASREKGTLREVFGSGTAAVISPVGEIRHEGRTLVINEKQTGPVAQKFYNAITGIQYGEQPDTHGWMERVV